MSFIEQEFLADRGGSRSIAAGAATVKTRWQGRGSAVPQVGFVVSGGGLKSGDFRYACAYAAITARF
ncbi:MAG: hypothetical protein CMJ18_16800 [Phycisphaeraceae bacterium]|nr:hypothetical protein [Phycisphaeraceae bacterium]